jgi:hypothetical protein
MPVISGKVIVISLLLTMVISRQDMYREKIMSKESPTKQVSHQLGLANCVEVRHLPHYTRFNATFSFSGAGLISRVYSPPSLASLTSTLVVANSTPEDVQR